MPTIKSLEHRLDLLSKKIARERDGEVKCGTEVVQWALCYWCGTRGANEVHHFPTCKHKSIRWNPDHLFPLHEGCHFYVTNHPKEFEDFLRRKLGDDAVDKLKRDGNRIQPITLKFLEETLENLLLTKAE